MIWVVFTHYFRETSIYQLVLVSCGLMNRPWGCSVNILRFHVNILGCSFFHCSSCLTQLQQNTKMPCNRQASGIPILRWLPENLDNTTNSSCSFQLGFGWGTSNGGPFSHRLDFPNVICLVVEPTHWKNIRMGIFPE